MFWRGGRRPRRVGRQVVAVVLAVAAVTGATACGESDEEQAREIRAAVERVQRAFATGDLRGVCDGLTEAGRRHIGAMGHDYGANEREAKPSPCLPDLRMLYDGIRKSKDWRAQTSRRIGDIRIDGDRATATVAYGGGASGDLPLEKEDGEWKVNGLYGGIPAERQEDHY